MTVTQVHENHQFAAIPLLAATAALDPCFALPFLTVSLCSFLNMALHDFLVGDALAAALTARLPWQDPLDVQTANATLNVAGFALFTLLLLRRPPGAPQTARALLWRARFVLVAGLAAGRGGPGRPAGHPARPAAGGPPVGAPGRRGPGRGPVEAHLSARRRLRTLLARAAVELRQPALHPGGGGADHRGRPWRPWPGCGGSAAPTTPAGGERLGLSAGSRWWRLAIR